MFKNRHIIAALIIAPILSIISYFSVDHFVSEKPHAAKEGSAYQLAAKPNCRYESGKCGLKNGDFEVTLTANRNASGGYTLQLESAFPLDAAGLAIVTPENPDEKPTTMKPVANNARQWQADFPSLPTNDQAPGQFRLALAADKTFYYAESSLAFVSYETSFGEDFR
ncbi:MAG: hypothetical protein MI976_16470 [Pseudomonadales bacterium]|nr:hypothetical protein [Pseudomonadales bacterium]